MLIINIRTPHTQSERVWKWCEGLNRTAFLVSCSDDINPLLCPPASAFPFPALGASPELGHLWWQVTFELMDYVLKMPSPASSTLYAAVDILIFWEIILWQGVRGQVYVSRYYSAWHTHMKYNKCLLKIILYIKLQSTGAISFLWTLFHLQYNIAHTFRQTLGCRFKFSKCYLHYNNILIQLLRGQYGNRGK